MIGEKILSIVAVMVITLPLRAADERLPFTNRSGSHAVGLRIVHQYDFARGFLGANDLEGQPVRGERSRPIQTLVWYPAAAPGRPVSYRDYRLATATATQFEFDLSPARRAEALQAVEAPPPGSGLGPDHMARENGRPMRAGLDAEPAPGRFPVVIYAPSLDGAAVENADLCEYLASHGYIVLASPSFGARSRKMTTDLEGAEAQVADIGFLSAYARTLPHAAAERTAVIGFSWGGLSNVLAAAKDSRIQALVCLDGGVRFAPEILAEAKYATADRLRLPVLFFASQVPPEDEGSVDEAGFSRFLRTGLRFADVTLVTMSRMQHWHFSSYLLRFNPDSAFAGCSSAEASQAYGWMARYTLEFLDAHMKGDPKARTFLQDPPAAQGVPARMLTVEAMPAHGFDFQSLADEAGRRGFQHLQEAYEEGLKRDPNGKPSDGQLKAWGAALMGRGKTDEAIAVFQLEVHLQPRSAPAYGRLGNAFFRKGDWGMALRNFQRALEFDPENPEALRGMMRLDAMPPAQAR